MILDLSLSIIFLVLLGLTILNGRYTKAGAGERPLMYASVFVQFILNIALLIFFALSVYLLFFYNWKFFLLLMVVGLITETLVIVPLIEKLLYFLLYEALDVKGKKRRD